MNDLLLPLALTFAGSAHCIGMCGGFAAAVSGTAGGPALRLLGHQLLLQLGKGSVYAFLGSIAGAFGAALIGGLRFGLPGRVLAVAAGIAILAAGLALLGIGRTEGRLAAKLAPLGNRIIGPLMESRPAGFPLVVGMVMGFLPCPLVYAGLGAAAATGSAARGALVMAGVALGTVPALLAVGLAGGALPIAWRRGLTRVAGVLLLVVGGLTAARGFAPSGRSAGHVSPASVPVSTASAPCPFCVEKSSETTSPATTAAASRPARPAL